MFVFVGVCVACVYCFLSDLRVTELVSPSHRVLNHEPFVIFRGGGVQGLVGDESNDQTCYSSYG